ncbi:tRNA preQ1(34) S-adenosylmethionine ribosyltransferase-isomerase QueA [Methyloversatilis discipulorum]|uniref:tRNA preQ1(34) S-adenosylmethionine ribosyltransferase-isomerase QueA n=1 Tax=Methyloversatilis discipulorum TaxID=1119528 RepID=UPI00035C9AB8|nr:tRNA preQ1(34) S-adenosylmethionine ribosyltransferase-isomerase QueA [Methyloversatilis discipulorum]
MRGFSRFSASSDAVLTLSDFDYDLPDELIAQAPLPERSASRLLVVGADAPTDAIIRDLPQWLESGDLLVFNDTRVMHARLYGQKDSGGQVEVLVERLTGEHEALAQVRASKTPKPGSRLRMENAFDLEVLGREGEFFVLRGPADVPLLDLLERHGRLPLPPYIDRAAAEADEERYQTVFARETGSVAAPTAGLHFDEALLAAVAARGVRTARVTLHVGAGTFQPVRVEKLAEHRMHSERFQLSADTAQAIADTRAAGRRVIAVGTTSLRCLESAAAACGDGPLTACSGDTRLFITPGYDFRVIDGLLTNFHLPKSTLLMLVSALAGRRRIFAAYAHAVAQRYRFFSYGDAMFIPARMKDSDEV